MWELGGVGWSAGEAAAHAFNFLNIDNTYYIWDTENLEDGIVGWTDFCMLPQMVVINYIIIKEEFRRRGYAAEIFKTVSREFGKNKRMQSFYYNHNEASRALHEKVGFKAVATQMQLDPNTF
jgi:predicted GNAT family acetyltransferase